MTVEREHGTPRGYRQHRRRKEETCQPCRDAWREACAAYRPPKPIKLRPCGTEAAYRRHRRAGEEPDEACVKAASAAVAERRADRAACA